MGQKRQIVKIKDREPICVLFFYVAAPSPSRASGVLDSAWYRRVEARSSYPGLELTVHCHRGFFVEHVHSGDSGRYPWIAQPHVHNHTEPLLCLLIAQGCQFKCPFNVSVHRSGQAIKGRDGPPVADTTLGVFDMATSHPMSCITELSIGTGHLFTLYHPRGLAHAAPLAIFGYHCLANLKAKSVYKLSIHL